ncbi:MAG: hypothetical protein HQL11_00965 [Candidatus Omnitrophica bacterium]|nr:hypothetical protein [Candidatus Omnitrophota bacterium]
MAEHRSILLIHYENDILLMLRGLLEAQGYQVIAAASDKDGLERLTEIRPNLILFDMNALGSTVAEFKQEIRESSGGRLYPLLVFAGTSQMEDVFLSMPIEGFVCKPFEIDELLMDIRMVLYAGEPPEGLAEIRQKRKLRKILLVDDDISVFERIAGYFLNAGYDVEGARSAVEGLEKASQTDAGIFVIKWGLLDYGSEQLVDALKYMTKTRKCPVIIYGLSAAPERAIQAFHEYFLPRYSDVRVLEDADEQLVDVAAELLIRPQ